MPAERPVVVDQDAHAAFLERVRMVFSQGTQWEIDYVDHEAARIGQMFQSGICGLPDAGILEFGCNIGATAIILAHQSATLTACDINPEYLALAQLNARRYGATDRIRFVRIQAGRSLPFMDNSFGLIVCNSVLEYVRASDLPRLQRDLDRVLRPGGRIVVFGTSNRLWPVERHSGRWLVNYIPTPLDAVTGRTLQRGVWPWTIRYGFGRYRDVLAADSRLYLRSRATQPDERVKRAVLAITSKLSAACGVSIGYLTPFVFAVLEKPLPESS